MFTNKVENQTKLKIGAQDVRRRRWFQDWNHRRQFLSLVLFFLLRKRKVHLKIKIICKHALTPNSYLIKYNRLKIQRQKFKNAKIAEIRLVSICFNVNVPTSDQRACKGLLIAPASIFFSGATVFLLQEKISAYRIFLQKIIQPFCNCWYWREF